MKRLDQAARDVLVVGRPQLDDAVAHGLLTAEQADGLWWHLRQRAAAASPAAGGRAGLERAPRFGVVNALYYLGGLIAIGAMSLFMTVAWELLGGAGILGLALAYAAGAFALALALRRRDLHVPAGLMLGLVVALAPLATWGLQQLLGLWPAEAVSDGLDTYASFHQRIDGRWLTLEAVTIATAAALLVRLRYPFLVLPIAATLWYLSMDLGAALAGQAADWGASFDFRVRFSLGFGLAMLGAALWLELRGAPDGPDWPFWLHVFGLLAAWPTQFHLVGSTVIGQAGLAVLGAAMVLAGAAIGRRSVSAFGGIGLAVALGRLSWDLLSDSLLLPFGLTALGLGLIGAGVWWTRHGDPIAHALRQALPQPLRAAVLARMARASA